MTTQLVYRTIFLPETNQSCPVFSARSRGQDSSNQHQNSNCEQQHQKGTAETEPFKRWREGHMRKYEVVCAMWEQLNCGIQAYPLLEDIACITGYLMHMHRRWKRPASVDYLASRMGLMFTSISTRYVYLSPGLTVGLRLLLLNTTARALKGGGKGRQCLIVR